ncbi:MAG TPA: hypothetical protein VMT66_07620 [Steroidobacteraceae bacterium]|nr:hypothetical protein [Steroidobacteraceae bacterium]
MATKVSWCVSAHPLGVLSGGYWGTAPRELPFEGGDPIAKRCILGFLIAQSFGEVEGNERENSEQSNQHALPLEVVTVAPEADVTVDPAR